MREIGPCKTTAGPLSAARLALEEERAQMRSGDLQMTPPFSIGRARHGIRRWLLGAGVVTPLFSIDRARHALQRWLRGEEGNLPMTANGGAVKHAPPPSEGGESPEEKISQFIEELKASSQEWLGKVRMINFDSIRERVGATWPKLQDRVEILAEKIIQDEMAGRDRYLKAGNAEFLVFFADATPEESRIRCFAIVEAIHEKLFGSVESVSNSGRRIAECRVVHRDDLVLEWEAASSSSRAEPHHQSSPKLLREPFRHDAEILDGADIAASTQIVIDSIISQAAESRSMAELTPLLMRLQVLSRSLKTLEPALIIAEKISNSQNDLSLDSARAVGSDSSEKNDGNAKLLGTTWEDIAELVSVVDAGSGQSHADLLAALGRLRRARLERTAKAFTENDMSPARSNIKKAEPMQFEYTPVYRSASRGEHIRQGIYRVNCRVQKDLKTTGDDDLTGHPRHDSMASERAILEHAIQYLLDHKTSARFMLMTSVHVETLRGPNSQMRYSMILRSAQLRAKKRLLIEVVGYRDSDDTIGIRRAIDELRVHSHAVFISLSNNSFGNLEKIAIESKRSGVHAFGMNISQFNGRNAESIDAITRLSSLGEQYSVPTFVNGIGSVPVLAKAIANGVCYVCAPALRPPLPTPDDAQCATLDDLYLAI